MVLNSCSFLVVIFFLLTHTHDTHRQIANTSYKNNVILIYHRCYRRRRGCSSYLCTTTIQQRKYPHRRLIKHRASKRLFCPACGVESNGRFDRNPSYTLLSYSRPTLGSKQARYRAGYPGTRRVDGHQINPHTVKVRANTQMCDRFKNIS